MRPILISSRTQPFKYDEAALLALVQYIDAWPKYTMPAGELSLVFMSEAELTDLHVRFFNDPTPTDVITFPGDREDGLWGEICISVDCAKKAAVAHKQSFAYELTLYLVHGCLHLLGYDDIVPEDRAIMRAAEAEIMHAIVANELIPEFEA